MAIKLAPYVQVQTFTTLGHCGSKKVTQVSIVTQTGSFRQEGYSIKAAEELAEALDMEIRYE
jgi:hypothetical protein